MAANHPRDVNERFDEKWMPEPNTGCWLWFGSADSNFDPLHMYGQFWHNSRQVKAHRFSYERSHGPIPDGAIVMHKCDAPWCVNPEHLVVGTHQENVDDMVQKGRARIARFGTLAHMDEAIFRLHGEGMSLRAIAREVGASDFAVRYRLRRARQALQDKP